jgi:hypothetical protein
MKLFWISILLFDACEKYRKIKENAVNFVFVTWRISNKSRLLAPALSCNTSAKKKNIHWDTTKKSWISNSLKELLCSYRSFFVKEYKQFCVIYDLRFSCKLGTFPYQVKRLILIYILLFITRMSYHIVKFNYGKVWVCLYKFTLRKVRIFARVGVAKYQRCRYVLKGNIKLEKNWY